MRDTYQNKQRNLKLQIQTDGQTVRKTVGQTVRETDGQTVRETDRLVRLIVRMNKERTSL